MLYFTLIAALLLGFCQLAVADDAHDRQLFQSLYSAAQSGHAAVQDFAPLRDYVLYPYLLAARLGYDLSHNEGAATDRRMAAFLKTYPDVYRSDGLRTAWLKSLADREDWRSFLAYVPDQPATTTQACLKARAQIATHDKAALAAASKLWLHGDSLPKECDPVIAWLQGSGKLSHKLVDERVRLAKEARNNDLVKYLAGLQSASHRRVTEHWLQLARYPERGVAQLAAQRDLNLTSHDARLLFEMLARKDTDRAAELYPKLVANHNLHAQDAALAAAYLGYVMMLSRESESEEWFLRAGKLVLNQSLSDWRLRSALYNQDWAAVLAWIELLPDSMREEPRWRYWHAHALLELGDPDVRGQAQDELRALATGRGYYHYLAADQLGVGYAFNDQPIAAEKDVQARLAKNLVLRRAHELWQLDFGWQARAEWRQLNDTLGKDELQQAALMAHGWGWHSESIISMQDADGWDDLSVRFPLAFKQYVDPISKMRGLDPAWVYGLMRSESLFMPQVRSPANAWGLMQLLPSTGRRTARKIGVRWLGVDGLQQPEYNVRLGTAYLKNMFDSLADLQPLATAAYNAGPNAVKNWLPDKATPGALWVEIIPYNETFRYVRTVLENTVAFEWRLLGKAKRLTYRLGTIVPLSELPDP